MFITVIECVRNLFGDAGAMPQAITVTPEEREAIERVSSMF